MPVSKPVTAPHNDQCGRFRINVRVLTVFISETYDSDTKVQHTAKITANMVNAKIHAKCQNSPFPWMSWICDFHLTLITGEWGTISLGLSASKNHYGRQFLKWNKKNDYWGQLLGQAIISSWCHRFQFIAIFVHKSPKHPESKWTLVEPPSIFLTVAVTQCQPFYPHYEPGYLRCF